MGCVYCVTNKVNGKQYVGKTVGPLDKRKWKHESDAKLESETYFHRALRKYGFNNFEWEILFESDNSEILILVEMDMIKDLSSKKPSGYNLTDGGEGLDGYTHSEETKRKIGLGNKGKNLGRKHTEEEKRKIGESQKGKIVSDETKNRMSKARSELGHKHTEESKKKMSISQKNRIREPHSEETRIKIGESQKGRNQGKTFEEIHGEEKAKEIKKKLSDKSKGRKFTEEHKRNLRISRRNRELKKKGGVV